MTEVDLCDIVFDGGEELIHTWQFVQFKDDVRIYYKPEEKDGDGFVFYGVIHMGQWRKIGEEESERWDIHHTRVECIFQGTAYFDGIRHLYYGSEQTDNYGYDYYPDIETTVVALNMLAELEKHFCRKNN